jgi:hypothetical protein
VNGAPLAGEMKPVDMCKCQPAAICTQGGASDFCKQKLANGKPFTRCCPEKTGGDCKAAGTPRKWMPQLIDERFKKPPGQTLDQSYAKFVQWGKKQTGWGDFSVSNPIDVNTVDLKPAQDEIFWWKSINKVCFKFGGAANDPPTGTPSDEPFIGSDKYIIDGHHRWSQAKACGITNKCGAVTKIKVKQCNKPTVDVLDKLMEWAVKAWKEKPTEKKQLNAEAAVTFDSFAELEARFGRTAHSSVERAAAAYVNEARANLFDMGLELKGGDSALNELFYIHHGHRWE